jgi:hypothetical protein
MQPVMAGEADRVAEEGRARDPQRELEGAAGGESAVREIAMKPGAEDEKGQRVEAGQGDRVPGAHVRQREARRRQVERDDAAAAQELHRPLRLCRHPYPRLNRCNRAGNRSSDRNGS